MRKKVIVLLSLLSFLGSCRYEEGPFMSFTPVKDRIRGQWKLSTVQKDDVATLSESPSVAENGDNLFEFYVTQRLQINYWENGTIYQADGFYEFSDNKKQLLLTFSDRYHSYKRTYDILKFKNKELKVQFTDEKNTKWTLEFSLIESFIRNGL